MANENSEYTTKKQFNIKWYNYLTINMLYKATLFLGKQEQA